MDTAKLKKFAQYARRNLIEQVSNKLDLVLSQESPERREHPQAVKKLEEQIQSHGEEQVIEKVAYIWFNRFCALRFMDVNRYTRIGVVSPAKGQFQPEILAEAKMGHIDEGMVDESVRQQIFALLDGKTPSQDPQAEAYRLLVVAICNYWHGSMPFMFERIADFTELLMPDDLLSGNSILSLTREAMTPDACGAGSNQLSVVSNQMSVISNQERQTNELTDGCGLKTDSSAAAGGVEVIGWLYQFYISEKKDEVFEGLKKNKKITPENIPAATQLFTPHWIVRYLVENSLGRLWMLNRPDSRLVEQMDYYIKPENQLTAKDAKNTKVKEKNNFSDVSAFRGSEDFLVVNSPEEIKICDPACGSGHMLTYAFDLLYAIYEEEGYEPAEIPEKILTNNLYGIEIDERAGELAAFALTMKARAKQRRFFRKQVQPNICVLENIKFGEDELKEYMDFIGRDLFTAPLQTTLHQFEEADNFGSLIRPDLTDVEEIVRVLDAKDVSGQLFLSETHKKVLQALRQADYLSSKYHVVIANPPYMGGKGMNVRLAAWAKDNYRNSKSDLFAMFIERNLELAQKYGAVSMITMQSWMFLPTFESMRRSMLTAAPPISVAHLGVRAFDTIGGEVVSTTAFVLGKGYPTNTRSIFIRLIDGDSELEKARLFIEALQDTWCNRVFTHSPEQFQRLPSASLAYWVSEGVLGTFESDSISTLIEVEGKNITSDNERFLRFIWEVASNDRGRECKWLLYSKGGAFRKWAGNLEHVVNWSEDARSFYRKHSSGRIIPEDYWYRSGVTWSPISTMKSGFRFLPQDTTFDTKGLAVFPSGKTNNFELLGILNSKLASIALEIANPTMSINLFDVRTIPIPLKSIPRNQPLLTEQLVEIGTRDWDSFETSWDFTSLPLLNSGYLQPSLNATYQKLRAHWREVTLKMQRLEEENNHIFIKAYGLEDELTPEVPLNEITLICNPHYRYNGDKSEDELEALLLADTMKEFISYAVGCMFGRYALEKPGLILANQGETIDDYYKKLLTAKSANSAKEGNTFSDFSAFRGSISFPDLFQRMMTM
ncbi:BREX-1 system adenine-specific DNA-methyltransferase PglX [Thiolapillus sp.]|uniref:BREX-1 system adenine-specific DNA-methyltransferase PglX n=1 Tax=Thiolapillus sp. TaxID=2017437 RepID=UPI003AF4307D